MGTDWVQEFCKGGAHMTVRPFSSLFEGDEEEYDLAGLLAELWLCASRSDAIRALKQGGVKVNGAKVGPDAFLCAEDLRRFEVAGEVSEPWTIMLHKGKNPHLLVFRKGEPQPWWQKYQTYTTHVFGQRIVGRPRLQRLPPS